MFIDTHCHLGMLINKDESLHVTQHEVTAVSDILQEAADNDVHHVVTISTTRNSIYHNVTLAQKFSSVSAAAGLHPCDYSNDWKEDISTLKQVLAASEYRNHIVAIGECGLDFHHAGYDVQEQKDVFKAQIEIALQYDLPIVVHSRKATEEALRVIEPYIQDGIRGVIHCYAGDATLAQDIRDKFGMYIGIAGPVTYPKNDTLREAVQTVGINNILLETDAPFLPPQVIRGKRNHPLYTRSVAEQVSSVLDMPLDEVGKHTTANANSLFGITTH